MSSEPVRRNFRRMIAKWMTLEGNLAVHDFVTRAVRNTAEATARLKRAHVFGHHDLLLTHEGRLSRKPNLGNGTDGVSTAAFAAEAIEAKSKAPYLGRQR